MSEKIDALQTERDELVYIFGRLPQELREKLLDIARMSEIFAEVQKTEVA